MCPSACFPRRLTSVVLDAWPARRPAPLGGGAPPDIRRVTGPDAVRILCWFRTPFNLVSRIEESRCHCGGRTSMIALPRRLLATVALRSWHIFTNDQPGYRRTRSGLGRAIPAGAG